MAEGPGRGAYVRALVAVLASMFLIRLAFGVTIITFGGYLEHEGDFVYSLVVTASPLLELVTVAVSGPLIDRYGRKGILLTGLGLGAVSLYGLALTRNVLLLGLIHAIHGVAAALILVTTLAIIATLTPPQHRGREMGLFNLANVFGWIAGFAVGLVLADAFAGRLEYTFVIAGALATAGLLFANRMITVQEGREAVPAEAEHRPTLATLAAVARNRNLLLLTAPWLIVFMLVGPLITFLPRVTGGDLNIPGGQTALAVLLVGALLVVSQLFWGRLSDKQGRESIMLVGAVGFALLMGVIVYAYFEVGTTMEVASPGPFVVGGNVTAPPVFADVPPDARAPYVSRVSPGAAPAGAVVTIEGAGFEGASRVRFAGVDAPFTVLNGTTILATVPGEAGSGPVRVTVPTPGHVIFASVTAHWAILLVLLFTALAFAPAGLAAIADQAHEGEQGTTMSTYSLTLSLGFIVGPPLVGFISDRFGGRGMVLYFAALAAGLLALVLTRFVQAAVTKTLKPPGRAT